MLLIKLRKNPQTPDSTSISDLEPKLIQREFFFTKVFLPFDPDSPPYNPYGLNTLRSVRTQSFKLSLKIYSLIRPSPPLNFPRPPLDFLRENLFNTTGYLFSNISTSLFG